MNEKLSEPQRTAIEMLSIGRSLAAVATALSIDPRTLYRWRRERDFGRALDARRGELWSSAADRLRALLSPSLDVLEQQLADSFEPARYRAANAILRIAGIRKGLEPAARSGSKKYTKSRRHEGSRRGA